MQTEATLVILIDGVEMVRKEIGGPEFIDLADRDGPVGRKAILDKGLERQHRSRPAGTR